jgi:hypothetical protein
VLSTQGFSSLSLRIKRARVILWAEMVCGTRLCRVVSKESKESFALFPCTLRGWVDNQFILTRFNRSLQFIVRFMGDNFENPKVRWPTMCLALVLDEYYKIHMDEIEARKNTAVLNPKEEL